MLKKDSYTTNTDGIPFWDRYEVMPFNSSTEMLAWVQDDKENFILSDRVYDAMVDCLERDMEQIIVATLSVAGVSEIDVLIRKPNFQKILSGYTARLLNAEKYEKLAEIKKEVQKYNLEI